MKRLTLAIGLVAVGAFAQQPSYPKPDDGLKWACEWTQHVEEPDTFVFPRISEDRGTLELKVSNWRAVPIQVLLQEWSVSADGDISALVPTSTRNGDVQTIVVPPISIPPHESVDLSLMMRSRHYWNSQTKSFHLSPIIALSCPKTPKVTRVTLTYAIFDGSEKLLRCVPIEVTFKWRNLGPA